MRLERDNTPLYLGSAERTSESNKSLTRLDFIETSHTL